MPFHARPLAELAEDLDGVHGRVLRLRALLNGLSLVFAAFAASAAMGGFWTREPLWAMSAGLAATASAAFGLCGMSMARAAARTPRIRLALAASATKTWRRA